MNELAIFIGGYADGKAIMIEPQLTVYDIAVPVKDSIGIVCEYRKERYRAEFIACESDEHRVFVLESIPMKHAVKKLIAGYRGSAG